MSTIVLPKSALRKSSRCYWETRSNVKGQYAPTRTDNQRQKYMKKIHLLLRILAVIGRYGSHLLIVMIFVPQKYLLKRDRNFRPSWILLFFLFFFFYLVMIQVKAVVSVTGQSKHVYCYTWPDSLPSAKVISPSSAVNHAGFE